MASLPDTIDALVDATCKPGNLKMLMDALPLVTKCEIYKTLREDADFHNQLQLYAKDLFDNPKVVTEAREEDRNYYTLVVWDTDFSIWAPELGAYDLDTVAQTKHNTYVQEITRIIFTNEAQEFINEAISLLDPPNQHSPR